jgi:hypothetical protein
VRPQHLQGTDVHRLALPSGIQRQTTRGRGISWFADTSRRYAFKADSGSLAAVCSAASAAAVRVFAPIAASVAGASARSAAFSLRLPSVAPARQGHKYAEQIKEASAQMERLRQDLVGTPGSNNDEKAAYDSVA